MIDLSSLNRFIGNVHLQMKGLSCLKTLLRKGDYMPGIDLKDAHFPFKYTNPLEGFFVSSGAQNTIPFWFSPSVSVQHLEYSPSY